MGNKVLSIVYQEADQVIDSAIAAVVNEIHNLGHTVKEVRLMGDTGEQKVALNTVAGVTAEAAGTVAEAAAPAAVDVIPPSGTPVTAPVTDPTGTGAPEDTPGEPVDPIKAREEELLAELAALRQQDPTLVDEANQSTSTETTE